MKRLKQLEIANTIGCTQPTVSKYLSNKLEISLSDAKKVSESMKIPITIFIDSELQKKYFGKSFIDNNK